MLDEQIQELCGHESPEEFRRAALALDLDRLPDRLQHLADEIARLDSRRGELNQALGREQQILKQMDGSARAAEAAEMAEELKARLAVDVEEYARLRLAAVVLRESIERYRQRSQGTVLDRAAGRLRAAHAGLIRGTADRLRRPGPGGAEGRSAPAATEAVGIEGLSLGTADQLYLALRLASLEAYLESHEPIPLIVDDILIQFDDERAAAALEALAELSRRTQVVLFTHHEHVCQLAQGCVDPDQLVIHCLPGRKAARLDGTVQPRAGGGDGEPSPAAPSARWSARAGCARRARTPWRCPGTGRREAGGSSMSTRRRHRPSSGRRGRSPRDRSPGRGRRGPSSPGGRRAGELRP